MSAKSFINDTWFLNSLFDIINQGLGSVSCRIIFASIQTSFKRKFRQEEDSCKKKKTRKKFQMSTHYNCSSICDTVLEKNAKINVPLNPIPKLFLKKRVLYVIRYMQYVL